MTEKRELQVILSEWDRG
jgi:hypothetical protein